MSGIQLPSKVRDLTTDQISLREVFRHQQSVLWGDCDPAQIAYTANIPSWGLQAIEAWYKSCLQVDWFQLNLHYGIGTPFVSLDFQFKSPVTPLHPLAIDVYVEKLGNSSLSHQLKGKQNDILCFTGNTTAAFVDASKMGPIPIPPNIRNRIKQYMEVQKL